MQWTYKKSYECWEKGKGEKTYKVLSKYWSKMIAFANLGLFMLFLANESQLFMFTRLKRLGLE